MQSSAYERVLLVAADLGPIENYDPTVPLGRITTKDSLQTGGLYLRATLHEMLRIAHLCEGRDENHRELIEETKDQYDNLTERKEELELLQKSRSILRPFKFMDLRRAKRAFREDAQELWVSTRTTSDRLKRAILSTVAANFTPIERDSVGENESVEGIVLEMPPPPPGEENPHGMQEAIETLQKLASVLASPGNSSTSPTPSNILNGQTTGRVSLDPDALSSLRSSVSASPSSPGSASNFQWLNLNLNIVNNTDSTAPGLTINNSGSDNSGSVVDNRDPASSMPS